MKNVRTFLRWFLPIALAAAAVFAAKRLIATRPEPTRKPVEDRGMLVEATRVHAGNKRVVVSAQGTVVAAYEVDLAAEITGRVIWKNPNLTTGGTVHAGEPLLKLDPRDYKIALAQQEAAVAKAQAEMELELGRTKVAEKEWNLFGDQTNADPDLALRKPYLRSVELGLESAESSREAAKLRLDRATVRAPFNAVVRENMTEMGRMVSPGSALARLVDTDLFMVVVSMPVEDLAWLRVPGVHVPVMTPEAVKKANAATDREQAFAQLSTIATVRQKVGDGFIERKGVVTRLLGDLDPVGRMARLLVAIRDPMGLDGESHADGIAGLPLLLGAYVSVELNGAQIDDVIEVPRLALRDGDRVFVASEDNKLEVRDVSVLRRRPDSVLVRGGLQTGDRLITSAMPSSVPGVKLRVKVSGEAEKRAEVSAVDGGNDAAQVVQ